VIGSGSVAALCAHAAFWAILGLGIAHDDISRKAAAIFLILWSAGFFLLPRISQFSGLFVTPYVAVIDIVLVFLVFKGDVPFQH
jgi:hypothetical protein